MYISVTIVFKFVVWLLWKYFCLLYKIFYRKSIFSAARQSLLRTEDNFGSNYLLNHVLLFGDAFLNKDINTQVLNATAKYIPSTIGFEEPFL